MFIKKFNIADINIQIETEFDYSLSENIIPFETATDKCDVVCRLVNKEEKLKFSSLPIGIRDYLRVYRENGRLYIEKYFVGEDEPFCCVEVGDGENICHIYPKGVKRVVHSANVFEQIAIENIFIKYNTLILHSSYIRYGDRAILFSAPSGTGKSTQAALWEKYENAELINGDKSAIKRTSSNWMAYGMHISGSSRVFKNVGYRLAAVVILKQAKENSVRRLSLIEGFRYIYSETATNKWDVQFVDREIKLLTDLVGEVPVYMLECTPDRAAVEALKNKLERDGVIYE